MGTITIDDPSNLIHSHYRAIMRRDCERRQKDLLPLDSSFQLKVVMLEDISYAGGDVPKYVVVCNISIQGINGIIEFRIGYHSDHGFRVALKQQINDMLINIAKRSLLEHSAKSNS